MTRTDDATEISVCVSTRNRAGLLPRLVTALEGQTVDPRRIELVVADDGSTDETAKVLEALQAQSTLRITIVTNASPGGPGAGRNLAWRAASAPLIAFTDDDCVPTPEWLQAHLAALASADIAQGKVLPNPAQTVGAGPAARYMGVTEENGLYETCNMAYHRSWLEKTGGFDPAFRRAAGEDTDLAWRARSAGASTTFVSDALVYHDVEPFSWSKGLRHARRWEAVVVLVDRYPTLRRRFGDGPTWRDAHRPAALAVAGLAAAGGATFGRRTPFAMIGLLATVPYIWHRLHRSPVTASRRDRIRLLVPMLTIDAAEFAVIKATRVRLRFRSSLRGSVAGTTDTTV